MKQQLVDNLKTLASESKACPYLSMQVDIPSKVVLHLGYYITQDEMNDLLAEFGNHAGLSYRLSVDSDAKLMIEIFVKP